MTWKEIRQIQARAKNGVGAKPETVLKLIAEIERLDRKFDNWSYPGGMRHPLDMD